MSTYRITYRDSHHQENTLPVISTSAVKAVADLIKLGHDVQRVVHSFPSV